MNFKIFQENVVTLPVIDDFWFIPCQLRIPDEKFSGTMVPLRDILRTCRSCHLLGYKMLYIYINNIYHIKGEWYFHALGAEIWLWFQIHSVIHCPAS